jgi:thioredoxin reductase (NADPH)
LPKIEDVVIVGSGPAGYTAAIYLSREDFKPLVLTGVELGGQLTLTSTVENYPGFPDGVLGSDLMARFKAQAEKFGTRFVNDSAKGVDLTSRPFKIMADSGTYLANSVILASGASAKWLGIASEKKFIGKGVSNCATCDAPFYRNKSVIIVGGGDTAMEDALFISKFANSVTIIHRRSEFRASKILQDRVKSNSKIKMLLDSVIDEVLGDSKVTGVRVLNVKTNEASVLKTDGLFVAIGYTPNTGFLQSKLRLDDQGYIVTKDEVMTDVEGVFVAGDVADKVYRQAVTAAASGAKAALAARSYLQNMKYKKDHKRS